MCEIPHSAPMGHPAVKPLDNRRGQNFYPELLDETNIDVLHTPGIHQIHNLFWQYPLWNVYRLWQPDQLHQLLLGLVQDFLHWLLKYLTTRNVKNPYGNRFSSVP